jgi:transposase
MRVKVFKVQLSDQERKMLKDLTSKGSHPARQIIRAQVLLALDEGAGKPAPKAEEIASRCHCGTGLVYTISKQYAQKGIERVLKRKQRETPPVPKIATGEIEAKIIALSCSEPPEGRSRWTLRLLEEKVVELGIVPRISDTTIRTLLKKRR